MNRESFHIVQFFGENGLYSPSDFNMKLVSKNLFITEIFKYFLMSKVSWIQGEMFCFTVVFVACSLCLYECTDSELETPYEQVTITAFIQDILLGRQCLEQR